MKETNMNKYIKLLGEFALGLVFFWILLVFIVLMGIILGGIDPNDNSGLVVMVRTFLQFILNIW